MINPIRFTCIVASFLLPLAASGALAADNRESPLATEMVGLSDAVDNFDAVEDSSQAGGVAAGIQNKQAHTIYGLFAGYRFMDADRNAGRAAQFDYLHSGITGGGYFDSIGTNLKFALEGDYLSKKDYHGDLLFDFAGEYRIHLRTEALYHNLLQEQLFSPNFKFGTAEFPPQIPPQLADYTAIDSSGANYGVKTDQGLVNFRYKLHYFPLHVNFGYWRFAKEGSRQLRFADTAFEGLSNLVIATSRAIDQVTHEGTAGFDAHLGPVDLIYSFVIRQFHNNAAIPRDNFVVRPLTAGRTSLGGDQQHNEDPESRYLAHTVKLHTSMAGGIVGAASYSYGKRENRSTLTDVLGARQSTAAMHNVAGDFTYTPVKEICFALKYRRQEVDNTSPASLYDSFSTPNTIAVRPSPDTLKDVVVATLSLKPTSLLTLKGEYRGELLQRVLPDGNDVRLSWPDLNDDEKTHRGSIALLSRPLKGLKLSARYSYQVTDKPSYGSTAAEKHEGDLLATYGVSNKWGGTASLRSSRESNDEISGRILIFHLKPDPFEPLEYRPYDNLLWRDKATNNLNVGIWFAPAEKLSVSANYGLLRSSIDQAVLFSVVAVDSSSAANTEAAANYTSQAWLYSLGATYHLTQILDLSLAFQQIYSFSEFQPENITFTSSAGTSGIKEISQSKTVESSFSLRGDYHLSKSLTCSLDYTLRDYRDKHASQNNGSIHSVMAQLSKRW